jgi:hypothetical protein
MSEAVCLLPTDMPSWSAQVLYNFTFPLTQGWMLNYYMLVIQGASVNRAILQHCFFWFGNTGADAAIAILLPTLKCFRCNGAVDWRITCFCCESVLQKRWQFCDRSAWISKRVRDSLQSCCSISPYHQDFEATGSTLEKKGGSVKTVSTPENIAVVREAIERSPHRSARRHSVSLGLLKPAFDGFYTKIFTSTFTKFKLLVHYMNVIM